MPSENSISLAQHCTLPASEWRHREGAHRIRVAGHAEAFVQRRSAGAKHPVWDFLFTYYSFSPNKLMTWCPGVGEGRQGNPDQREQEYEQEQEQEVTWTWPALPDRIRREAAWVVQLCANIADRPARFACHGLHEWAMVYKQSADQVRHGGYELRMSPEALAAFVESQNICCTHYDAFRFYTSEARPLNSFDPKFETRLEMEQGGCLHANMDLYKWAYKLWPWVGSDLVADAFELAVFAREMDMRASPYELTNLGFSPIRIETEEGRVEYRASQQELARRAEPIRERLRTAADEVAAWGM